MRLLYMAYPVSGDVSGDVAGYLRRAGDWMKWIEEIHSDVAVIADWLIQCEIWDDDNPEHRAAGLRRVLAVLERCDELWLVGPHISEGMALLQAHAEQHDLLIRNLTGAQTVAKHIRQLEEESVEELRTELLLQALAEQHDLLIRDLTGVQTVAKHIRQLEEKSVEELRTELLGLLGQARGLPAAEAPTLEKMKQENCDVCGDQPASGYCSACEAVGAGDG